MNTASWFAKKLGQPEPPSTVAQPNRPSVMPVHQPSYQAPPAQARSAQHTASCPDCGSENYFGPVNSRPKCFDCGYPLEQSGSGMIVQQANGPTIAAKQGQGAGWNPNVVHRSNIR